MTGKRRRTGIFGGTFNPVHAGHIRAVRLALDACKLDRMLILPAGIPPHKNAPGLAPAADRLAMCRLAFVEIPQAQICDYEAKQAQKTFTVHTLRWLGEEYPQDEFVFVMGGDMLLSFMTWYCWEEILMRCELAALSREPDTALFGMAEKLRAAGGKITLMEAEQFPVSSTQIRGMLKKKQDCSCYLPQSVVQYIMEHRLYQA